MNKKLNLFLFFSFLLLSIVISCKKEEPRVDYQIKNAKQIVDNYNAGKLPHDKGELLEGNIYMRGTNDNKIVVFVESNDLANNLAYLIHIENSEYNFYEETVENAQIIFMKECLIINSINDSACFLFKLKNYQNSNDINQITFSKNIVGYGIGKHIGFSEELSINNINTEGAASTRGGPGTPISFAVECTCEDGTDSPQCESGGPGASSCSTSVTSGGTTESCSVSCTGLYYACCDNDGD
jgi:hypothetical protein